MANSQTLQSAWQLDTLQVLVELADKSQDLQAAG